MWRSVSVCLLLPALLGAPARASGKWPKPAAGESASGDPELVLTFDDGPHERYTPLILDELRRRGLHAVFFWVGYRISSTAHSGLAERRALVRRAIAEGQLVGNHTVTHAHLCLMPAAQAAREIDDAARLITDAAGMPPLLFRTPYGSRCRRLLALLAERRLGHLHWDIDPHEWESHNPRAAAAAVIRRLKQIDGRAVLLMHDTHAVTVEALPLILDWIDAENQRRLARGGRPIRIVSFGELAREQLAPGLAEWARAVGQDALGRGRAMAGLVPGAAGTRLSRLGPL